MNRQRNVILCENIHQENDCILPSCFRNFLEDLNKLLSTIKRGLKEHFLDKFAALRSSRVATVDGREETCEKGEESLDRKEVYFGNNQINRESYIANGGLPLVSHRIFPSRLL
jgi:hypothetical protein